MQPVRIFRRGGPSDLPSIYRMQDVPFREKVFAGPLPPLRNFLREGEWRLQSGEGILYILECDGRLEGFAEYLKTDEIWDIIVWGRWLSTLIYLALKTAFESLGFQCVHSEVRREYRRVTQVYQRFGIRKIGQATVPYRSGKFGDFHMADFFYYEMTADDYAQNAAYMESQSLKVTFEL